MNTMDLIRRMHRHRQWADERLLTAARGLSDAQLRQPFPIGQGSIWATLVHLYGAEHAWIETLEGRVDAPVPGPDVFANLGQLADAWPGVHRRWWAFLDTVDVEELTRPVARRSVSTAGRTRQMPLHDVLIHVCTHAQYTGAQMTNMLRQSGVSDLGSAAISMTVLSRAEHRE